MINLNIKYSPKTDIKRVKDTLKILGWFKENGYIVSLPESISELSSQIEISKAVEKEYLENVLNYDREKISLLELWEKYSKDFEEKLISCSLKVHPQYNVFFTCYGTGGSYGLLNGLIVNLKKRWGTGLLKTVIHEMIHLSIEEYIKEYKINHWTKEHIVDLILEKFFPDISKRQNMPINTEEIDKNFSAYYPDIVKIIEETSKEPKPL